MTRWLRVRLWFGRNLLALLGIMAGLALAFLFVAPLLISLAQSLNLLPPRLQRKSFELLEHVHWWAIRAIICAWIFALGCSIASFLNVVAYRLSRGQSILGRSHCPHCGQQLSVWDNIPIFGWLRNGGRCGTCRLPISIRYLLVELILGTVFLVVFLSDVGTIRTIQALQFMRHDSADGALASLILFVGHALLLSLLFVAALVQWEKASLPMSLIWFGWVAVPIWYCVFQIGFPYWQALERGDKLPDFLSSLSAVDWLSTGASLLVAFVLGAMLPLGVGSHSHKHSPSLDTREAVAFAWIGPFQIWPIVAATGLITAALIIFARCTRCRYGQPFACLFLAMFLAILCQQWSRLAWIYSTGRSLPVAVVSLAALAIGLSLIARKIDTASD